MDRLAVAQFLASVSGFASLSAEDLEQLATSVQWRKYRGGDKLIRRGDAGDSMFVLQSGRVRVPIVDPTTGREKLVVQLGPRDLVGEMAMLTGERRNADVIADGDVEALIIEHAQIQPLLKEAPGLARFLTEILGRRLEEGGSIERVGKYQLLGKLGEGATSKVYEGRHPTLDRVVAIKMLSHTLVYDDNFKTRFLQEAKTIAGLTHPNIVQIYDTEAGYATYFIVMEKVSGADLSKRLKASRVMAPVEAMEVLRQVGAALQYAHREGIVHRDIKPANCAVDTRGVVKLMDFGIASRVQKSSTERAKVVEGTPRYLAPEAAVGRPVDGRADIYSLGIMAFEMVTGRVPFYSDTIRELLEMHVKKRPPDVTRVRPGLPEGIVSFINGALIKRPDERLVDWDQILKLLDPRVSEQVPDLRARPQNEELLAVRYPDAATEAVRNAVARFMKELASSPGVELAHARLVQVSMAENDGRATEVSMASPALAPAPSDRGATLGPDRSGGVPRSTQAWMQRLVGADAAEPKAAGPITRQMPTTEE